MKKATIVATVLVLGGPLATRSAAQPPAIPGAGGTLWVTERGGSTVTAYDAATGHVLGLGPIGVGAGPIGVTAPRDTGMVYVSTGGTNQLSVIDKATLSVQRRIATGPDPHHLMASSDGSFVYVAEFGSRTIGVIDTASDTREKWYEASPLPDARTHAVWITRDGEFLYAANTRVDRSQRGDIAKLDAHTGQRLWKQSPEKENFEVGKDPSEILVTPDGTTAYVSIRGESVVRVYDLTGDLPVEIWAAEAKSQPDTLSLTPDLKTLAVGLRASSDGKARMALVDIPLRRTIYVPLGGPEGPHTTTGHQWLSANGRYTFIGVESPGGIVVVDNRVAVEDDPSQARVAYYPYPRGGLRPHGVFYEPQVLATEPGVP
jgi:YVTN family beta-propeller protein